MNKTTIPSNFVFTKMQSDAGEGIDIIRKRKELERVAGDGVFWWGIGESKGQAIEELRFLVPRPWVLFSLMLSQPSAESCEPADVLLWQALLTPEGNERPLPQHVIITSNARTRGGSTKNRYHALVCESHSSITHNGDDKVSRRHLVNIGINGRPLGSSQVTAAVRHDPQAIASDRPYEIAVRARLKTPFFADLTKPRKLSSSERRLLNDVGRHGKTVSDWLGVTNRLRRL